MSVALPADELRDIADRVDRCPSVARRSGGSAGSAASYLPGERIVGVRTVDEHLEVHVVMRSGSTVSDVSSQVGEALSRWADLPVDLVIEDIETDTTPEPGAQPRSST